MSYTYKCATCGGTFNSGWTEEEARAEKDRDFPNLPNECTVTVCDDCYQRVRPDQRPDQWAPFRNLNN